MRNAITLALLLSLFPITATAAGLGEGLTSSSNLLLDYRQEERQQRIADQQVLESQQRVESGLELRSVDDPRWGTFQKEPRRRSSSSQWHRAFEQGQLPAQQRAVDQMNQNHHDDAWDY